MKIKDLYDVFTGDVCIVPLHQPKKKTIKAVPIGRRAQGNYFIMDLTIRKIEITQDACGVLAWVDLPIEMLPGLIKCNDGFYINLEWCDDD